jgi:bacterioferritin (cytochrome b1)
MTKKIALKKMLNSVSSLYGDIDLCIGTLVKSRIEHDTEMENKACAQMESLIVASAQEFTCIMDFLKDLLQEEESDDVIATAEAAMEIDKWKIQKQ